jgi:hypothetical protein
MTYTGAPESMQAAVAAGFLDLARCSLAPLKAQHADEKEVNCDHQPQSCSDSVTGPLLRRMQFSEATGGMRCELARPHLILMPVAAMTLPQRSISLLT